MGRLVKLSELETMASWVFHDAYYDPSTNRYRYEWPSKDFPYSHAIHLDKLENQERIQIRKWVENTISDTVILEVLDRSYRKYYGEKMTWDHSYEKVNRWYQFSFENEHSALMFKIAFSNLIQPVTNYHPDSPDDRSLFGE